MCIKKQNLIRDYLRKNSPESYNFEKEYGDAEIASLSTLDRYFRYQAAQSSSRRIPHPDGSGGRTKGTELICDIYEALWSWNRNKGSYFTKIRFDAFQCEFGADTMNSVQTLFNKLIKKYIEKGNFDFEQPIGRICVAYLLRLYKKDDKKLCSFLTDEFFKIGFDKYIDCYHTIGNLVLVPAYFNAWRYNKTNDFWDDSLILLLNKKDEEEWLDNNNNPIIWSKKDFIKYINYFFLWDYVSMDNKKYSVKSLHKSYWQMEMDKDFEEFFQKVTCYIQRRGIFMIAMLKIQQDFSDVYKKIQNMLLSDTTYEGYADVVENIKNLTEDKTIHSMLDEAICSINKI